MNIKNLISKLPVLTKSASFVFVTIACFTICNQVVAKQNISKVGMVCNGGPVTDDSAIKEAQEAKDAKK